MHLPAAGTAPGSPEVDENPLAAADVLAEFVDVAINVGLLEVQERLADDLSLHFLFPGLFLLGIKLVELPLEVFYAGMLGVCVFGIEKVFLLVVIFKGLVDFQDESGRNDVVSVLFEYGLVILRDAGNLVLHVLEAGGLDLLGELAILCDGRKSLVIQLGCVLVALCELFIQFRPL